MASRRTLPGFLRRSLRREVEVDSDEVESSSSSRHSASDAAELQGSNSQIIVETSEATAADPPKEAPNGKKVAPVDTSDSNTTQNAENPSLNDSWQELPTPTAPAPPQRTKSYHEQSMERALQAPVVNLRELRKLGWNGIPPIHRATAWKLLLGYLPTNATRRSTTLQKRRQEYADARQQHYYSVDDNARTLQEQEMLRQVLVDVPRTAPTVPLFRHERIRRSLTRILYIWAMRHPASSYVQGINDLATPLIVAFLADHFEGSCETVLDGHVMNHLADETLEALEADVYGCLTNLLAGIQDHYTADQPGVQRMVMRLEELVQRMDANLCRHFEESGVQFLQFAFKWMNCLLLREFSLQCVVRLWDTYISETDGFEDFHVYVCAAFLCQFSGQLQQMSFDEMFQFLQDMPSATQSWTDQEIEVLLSQAYVLSTLFGGSDAHLTAAPAGR